MRIAVVGDIHLISDRDPYKGLHRVRGFFKAAWPSFRDLVARINAQSPDLVIFLGDLVDWLSPENVDFALDLAGDLRAPWHVTPGNHDLAPPDGDTDLDRFQTAASRDYISRWNGRGIDLSNRVVDLGDGSLLLMDSALSDLPEGTEAWLARVLASADRPVLFTHVPIDTPEARACIQSIAPGRNMSKYVLSGAPWLFDRHLDGRIEYVFAAHVHLPLESRSGAMSQHILGMAITMHDPGRDESSVAAATILDLDEDGLRTQLLTVE